MADKGFTLSKSESLRRGPSGDGELRQPQSTPLISAGLTPEMRRVSLRHYSHVVTRLEREAVAPFYLTPAFLSGKSLLITWLLCINAVVGSGVLGIPYAFQKAGLGLSVVFLMLITALAMATATYLMEAQSRMQALVNLTLKRVRPEEETTAGSDVSKAEALCLAQQEVARLLSEAAPAGKASSLPPLPSDFDVHNEARVFEVNELCDVFLGYGGRKLWEMSILLEVYACLWLYCAMMGSTLLGVLPIPGLTDGHCDVRAAVLSPGCQAAYGVWLIVIAAILVPITLRDLKDVGLVQIALTYTGYCLMGVMILTVGWAIFTVPCPGVETRHSPPYVTPQSVAVFSGFGLLFSTTVFTQMCHIAIPSLTQVLKEKRDIRTVVVGGMGTTYVLYTILGTATNLYFGPSVATIITLNWRDFAWSGHLGPITQLLNTAVVLLPFVTIANAFPINAHALANNVVTFLKPSTWKAILCIPDEADALLSSGGPPPRVKLAARLICVLPPFLFAFLQRDPSRIVTIIGVFGFVLMFFIPCALQIQSVRLFTRIWPNTKGIHRTRHSTLASEVPAVLLLLLLSSVGFAVNFRNVVQSLLA